MPNWCYNRSTITGPKTDIERLRNECFTGDDLDFEKVLPTPAFGDTDTYTSRMFGTTEIGEECWYYWRLDNWRTKWDVEESITSFGEIRIETSFFSAWSPPIGIYNELVRRYPSLVFCATFFEPGWGFAGRYAQGVVAGYDSFRDDEEYRRIGETFGVVDEEDGDEEAA